MESYNHIELEEDEVTEAMIWAKRKKEGVLIQKEKELRAQKNRDLLTGNKWGIKQTEPFMLWRADQYPPFKKKFKVDETNEMLFRLLVAYFSPSEESRRFFIEIAGYLKIENPDYDKGLMMAGNFGVGKTWMMQLFQANQRQCFRMRPAKHIADAFEVAGEETQQEFVYPFKNTFEDPDVFFQKESGLCIDDIGTEDVKNHYGNKKNVIGDLFEIRYSKKTTGIMLHATTNLTTEQLKDFYGMRVVSRMREIFNFVELPGEDRRK